MKLIAIILLMLKSFLVNYRPVCKLPMSHMTGMKLTSLDVYVTVYHPAKFEDNFPCKTRVINKRIFLLFTTCLMTSWQQWWRHHVTSSHDEKFKKIFLLSEYNFTENFKWFVWFVKKISHFKHFFPRKIVFLVPFRCRSSKLFQAQSIRQNCHKIWHFFKL